jgi:hypothetical protein
LPWSGGFLSWPAYDYTRLRLARVVRHIVTGYYDAENPATWQNDNPQQFKLIAYITRERKRIAKPDRPPFKESVIGHWEKIRNTRIWQLR